MAAPASRKQNLSKHKKNVSRKNVQANTEDFLAHKRRASYLLDITHIAQAVRASRNTKNRI